MGWLSAIVAAASSVAIYRTFLSVRPLLGDGRSQVLDEGIVKRAPSPWRCSIWFALSTRVFSLAGIAGVVHVPSCFFINRHPVSCARFAKRTPTSTERLDIASSP